MTEAKAHSRVMVFRRYTDVNATLALLKNRAISFTKPASWFDKNDGAGLTLYANHMGAADVFGFCLTGAKETSHHWQLFSGHSHGICILFKRKLLIDQFKSDHSVHHGNVKYLSVNELRNIYPVDDSLLPFLKRNTFSDEREYRAISTNIFPGAETFELAIKLETIHRVVVGPAMPQNLYLNFKSIVRGIEGCGNMDVTRSMLPNNGAWNRALRTGK